MKLVSRLTAVLLLCIFIACNQNKSALSKSDTVAPNAIATQQKAVSDNEAGATFKGNEVANNMLAADSTAQAAPDAPEEQTPTGTKQNPNRTAPPPPNIDWDKKIIRNATLAVEVEDFKKYAAQMQNAVKQAGGYISQSEQNKSEYKIENVVTIKVPVDQFDVAVGGLTNVNAKDNVVTQRITSQDVTGEVIDTRSRLEAKKQVRDRYMELLKQAKNMKEILEVQQEINDLQIDMESAAGRVAYLNHASALSTIELTYYQVLDAKAVDNTTPGFGKRVLDALGNGFSWMGEVLLVLLNLWPLSFVIIAVWVFYKRTKKSLQKTT